METQTKLPIKKQEVQHWHKYRLAKTNEKRLFYELLQDLCKIIQEPECKKTGRPKATLKDLVFSLGLKIYSNYSQLKTHSDLINAKEAGFISKVPACNTINDFLNCKETYDLLLRLLTITAMPIRNLGEDIALDSSGFGSSQYEKWQFARVGKPSLKRNYLKAHIAVEVTTHVICSCSITCGNFHDVKQAPKLLEDLKDNFHPKRILADKAYASYRTYQIIQSLNAIPYIPFKKNIKSPSKDAPSIWIRMFNYFQERPEQYMHFYHKRSNVETTFHMVKSRLGEFLKCKNFNAQRNEILMKFICHNICCLIQEKYNRDIMIKFRECNNLFIKHHSKDAYPETAIRDY
jgi:transposase